MTADDAKNSSPKTDNSKVKKTPIGIRAVGDWPNDRVDKNGDIVFSEQDQKLLYKLGEVVTFGKNEPIFLQGEPCGKVWLVLSGLVRIQHMETDGKRTMLAFYWQGDIFGLSENGVYINTALSGEQAVVMRFDREAMRAALMKEPGLQGDLLLKASAEWRQSERHALLLAKQPADRKIAAFLLHSVNYPGCFTDDGQILDLPFTREDVAEYLGMTVETISRALTRLEQNGLVRRISARQLWLSLSGLARLTTSGN